mmetsp:Transcript_107538/g.335277  ORF Transcript_107538/g.335277 Transcript_107538/m.335277 type:complete len:341 (+) Transcript_107538:1537-2559(+)
MAALVAASAKLLLLHALVVGDQSVRLVAHQARTQADSKPRICRTRERNRGHAAARYLLADVAADRAGPIDLLSAGGNRAPLAAHTEHAVLQGSLPAVDAAAPAPLSPEAVVLALAQGLERVPLRARSRGELPEDSLAVLAAILPRRRVLEEVRAVEVQAELDADARRRGGTLLLGAARARSLASSVEVHRGRAVVVAHHGARSGQLRVGRRLVAEARGIDSDRGHHLEACRRVGNLLPSTARAAGDGGVIVYNALGLGALVDRRIAAMAAVAWALQDAAVVGTALRDATPPVGLARLGPGLEARAPPDVRRRGATIAVPRVDLHRRDMPRRRRVDELRVA